MRIARQDEFVESDRVVLVDQVRDFLVAADKRGARPAADQPEARPQIGVDLQLVDTSAVQRRHPALSLGLRLGVQLSLFGDLLG